MNNVFFLDFNVAGVSGKLIDFTPRHTNLLHDAYFHHRHRYFEMHCIQNGSCSLVIDGEPIRIDAGSFCLITPNHYHSIKEFSPDVERVTVGFSLSSDSLKTDKKTAAILEPFSASSFFIGPLKPVERTLEGIEETAASTDLDFFSQEKLRVLASLLLLELAPLIQSDTADSQKHARTFGFKNNVVIDNFMIDNFLNTHFHLRGGEQLLADELHMSCRQLNRIFKNLYGKSYREKIVEIRLEVSLDLLKNSSKSISEIATLVGYESPSSFCYFIKKVTGRTPGEIQRSVSFDV